MKFACITGVGVGGIFVDVGVGVVVRVGVSVGVDVLVGTFVGVEVAVGVDVGVGGSVGIGVAVAVGTGVSLATGVADGLSVGVAEGAIATSVGVDPDPHAPSDRMITESIRLQTLGVRSFIAFHSRGFVGFAT
jgi:hypothetical protein